MITSEEARANKGEGRLLGYKQARAVNGPREMQTGRSTIAGGSREGKKEKWAENRQPNAGANGLVPERKNKGKEKVVVSLVQRETDGEGFGTKASG
ncbi:hypothetical protein DKX38_003667 [Salix brachista]|uniref:Uncharacterized protein n=1 Tax=Salix brachista TaxID=2182728 RepID=A0A5N5NQT5_9ROSI|nr:hypothetical protein DKX38_003667 [Salix brachista]